MSPAVAVLRNYGEGRNWSMKLHADQLVQALKEAKVAVLDISGPPPFRLPPGPEVLGKAESYLGRYWRYPRDLLKVRADLYHIVDHANAHWLRVLPPERTVVTCHDLILMKFTTGPMRGKCRISPIAACAFRWSLKHLRRARAVWCVSEWTKRDVVALLGLSPDRIFVANQGLHEYFRPVSDPENLARARRRFRFTWPETIVHIGHNFFYKNLEGLIEALALLPAPWNRRVHLVKAGDDFTPAQWDLIRRRGLGERVHSLGRLTLPELALLYNLADALVFPSLYEGFGWPPLEAMACGTPVICSDRGGMGEIAGPAACLVNPEDPLAIGRGVQRVLEDEAYRRELVRRGFERAEQFSRGRALENIRRLYHSILAGLPSSGPGSHSCAASPDS